MDALQRAVPVPQHEVVVRRALRRQILRQRLPLAAGREHVEDRVQNLAHIHVARSAAAPGRRDQRRDQRPFGVRQITRIAQAAPLGSTAMFRLPHRALLRESSANTESQPIHPTQLLLGSALSVRRPSEWDEHSLLKNGPAIILKSEPSVFVAWWCDQPHAHKLRGPASEGAPL